MPLGWAIVSAGRHPDQKMAPALNAAKDTTIAAVVSRDIARAEAFAHKHHAARAYDDFDAMLRDSAVDIVYVASPNALHAHQTARAAAAGKHVLCEKPMALSVEDCDVMIHACRRAGVQLGLGFHLRHHPGFQRLRALAQDGAFGTVSLAQANWMRGVRGQPHRPPRPALQQWWEDPALVGAGVFMGTGVHCVDTLRFVLGTEVTHVMAMTDATLATPLEEFASLLLRFADGSFGTVLTSVHTPGFVGNDASVYGSAGSGAVRGGMDTTLRGELDVATDALTATERYEPDPVALYVREVHDFNNAVRSGASPLATGLDGRRVAEVTVAMAESWRTGRRVALGVDAG